MLSKTIKNQLQFQSIHRFDNPLENDEDFSGGGQKTAEEIEAAKIANEAKIAADAKAAEDAAKLSNQQSQEQSITINNTKYKLDENGNALNDDDTVFKTKEELSGSNIPDTIIGRIQYNLGIDVADEEGNPISFADTEEGISEYVQKVIEISRQKIQEDIEEQFKAQLDENFRRYYNAISSGMSEEDYFKDFVLPSSQDFNVTSKSTDEDYVRIIAKAYELQNVNPKKALEFAQFSITRGTGKADAIEAEKEIAAVQTQKEIETEKKRIEQEKQNIKEINDYWNSIKTTIKSGKIKDIVIPVADQDKFFEYQSAPVKDNMSQFAIDLQKAGLEGELLMKYMFFKGFNTNNILRDAMNREKVETITEKLAAQKKLAALGGNNPSGNLKEIPNDF